MPGILPMKVIRVGNSAQSRIAQACDRCRSKKIRCNGIRPQCTQCANVGFECKTSDKLSRRAFPRGYTESLEDRVRGLEAEVRELKDVLDQKDEKIDMLSHIHSFSSPSRKRSASLSPPAPKQAKPDVTTRNEELVHVETPISIGVSDSPSSHLSASILIDASAREVCESEPSPAGFQGTADSLPTMETASPYLSQPSPKTIPAFVTDCSSMSAPDLRPKSAHRQLQSIASRFSSLTKPHHARTEDVARRPTAPTVGAPYPQSRHRASSRVSLSSTHSLPVFSITSPPTTQAFVDQAASAVNLDYLPLGQDSLSVQPPPTLAGVAASPHTAGPQCAEGMENSCSTKYVDLYRGLQDQILQSGLELDVKALRGHHDWAGSNWPMDAVDLYARSCGPLGILDISKGSPSSGGDEFSGAGSNNGSISSGLVDHTDTGGNTFKGVMTPSFEDDPIDIDGFVVQN